MDSSLDFRTVYTRSGGIPPFGIISFVDDGWAIVDLLPVGCPSWPATYVRVHTTELPAAQRMGRMFGQASTMYTAIQEARRQLERQLDGHRVGDPAALLALLSAAVEGIDTP